MSTLMMGTASVRDVGF